MIGLEQSLLPPLPTPLRHPIPPPPTPHPQSAKLSHHFSRKHALPFCTLILYIHHLPRIQRLTILTQHGIALVADLGVVDTVVGESSCGLECYYAGSRC
jgi:hypothetical protein